MRGALCALAALLASQALLASGIRQGHAGQSDLHGCEVTCQRFGMKALAEEFRKEGKSAVAAEFEKAGNPTKCTQVCEEAYAAAAPVAPAQGGAKVG